MIVSAIIFAVSHSYGLVGILSVFSHGIGLAFITWYTKGLEASSSAHIANNLMVIMLSGLGLTTTNEGGFETLIFVASIMAIYCAIIVVLDRRFAWFTSQGDGTIEFNEKYHDKAMRGKE